MEHDGCSGCKYEQLPDTSEQCKGCKQNAVDKYTRMTNADNIRAMSDEELAEFISSGELAAICPVCEYYRTTSCYLETENTHKNCVSGIINWLQSEVDEKG